VCHPLTIAELVGHLGSCRRYFAAHHFCNGSAQNNLVCAGHEAKWVLSPGPAVGEGAADISLLLLAKGG